MVLALAMTAAGCTAGWAFDLQAHRGTRGLMPENSLASFAEALRIGVDTLELDIAITRDGVLVISHDPALNPDITRGPDGAFLSGRGPLISSLSFDELSRYDVGRIKPASAYARQFPDQKAIDGTRIPRLVDLFELVQRSGNTQVRFAIETKLSPLAPDETLDVAAYTRAVLATIEAAGMTSRSSLLSFDWRSLQLAQREAPAIPTVYLSAQNRFLDNIQAGGAAPSPWTAGIAYAAHGSVPRMVKAAGGHTWSVSGGDLTPSLVAEAKSLGLKVLVWTINEARPIGYFIDMGVDGLVTDRPDRAREEMKRRGMPLPPQTLLTLLTQGPP
ncbi:MAG: glycerophosphodiester phosphodiesterase [Pseudomonadota bacterium]